jgi:hypothetical protein
MVPVMLPSVCVERSIIMEAVCLLHAQLPLLISCVILE